MYKTVNSNDKAFYFTDSCKSCGLCSEVCPTNNICMDDGHPVWKSETCQRCLACLHLCPATCIQYGTLMATMFLLK
ncbi:MAG: EFR1 family ferrodoxin [Oscillospiraceae bacterium]|nr:EFR1 family ferrodoxin [Oscillospiraceae bacterium]